MLDIMLTYIQSELVLGFVVFIGLVLFFQLDFFHQGNDKKQAYGKKRKLILSAITAFLFTILVLMFKYLTMES